MIITIASSNWNFLHPIESEFSKHHQLIGFYTTNMDSVAVARLQHLLLNSDVVFFDFAQEPLLTAQRLFHRAKIVVRLHGIEIFHMFEKINWNKVDLLITSPVQHKRIKDMVDFMPCQISEHNIGTETWLFKPIEHNNNPLKICMVGNILPHKGIYTALQTLAPLIKAHMCEFTIHGQTSPGAWRDEIKRETVFSIRELIDTLKLDVNWIEPQEAEEYAKWLAQQDIILSNSEYEGYHKAIFDAMACGVYPLVNCWYGADFLFKEQHLFYSLQEMRHKVERLLSLPKSMLDSLKEEMTREAELHHDSGKIAAQIREEIECLVK